MPFADASQTAKCQGLGLKALRASRDADLRNKFGLHRVCVGIGDAAVVAMKNFALLRDSDYLDVLNDAVECAEELRETSSTTKNSRKRIDKDKRLEGTSSRGDSNPHEV